VNDKLFVIAIVSFIPGGIAPGALSSIGELSPSIEICRAISLGPSGEHFVGHISAAYSPLHQAVNHEVHRISMSIVLTTDHRSCTSGLFRNTLNQSQA